MGRTTDSEAPLSLAALLLLVAFQFCPARVDSHSFCCNFPVDPQPSPGEPWGVAQGQVDGNAFLSYDCGGAMIQSTNPLEEEVKTMNTWETQRETLRDIGDFLKGQLPDIILEKHTPRDPLTLQGRMTCGVKRMDASVDPGSLASMEKCASALIQRMGTGQWIILEGGGLKRSGRRTEL
ncbi:hypothetical protein CapIbe_008547 [Capra ibex]